MKFRKTVVLASLLMFCFASAGTLLGNEVNILFKDTTDGVLVSVGGVVIGTGPCNGPTSEQCVIQLPAFPTNATITTTGPGGTGSYPNFAFFAEPGTNATTTCPPSQGSTIPSPGPCISDSLHTVIASNNVVSFTFNSDPQTETSLPACSVGNPAGGCQFNEDGTEQEVGTITVTQGTSTTTYHVLLQSDVVPEPTSLILFGSGLAIAGGFLRRRWIVKA
jgi:hypothetical protein